MTAPLKERLMDALRTSVSYFNSNNDPNSSIVKAASEFEFNADQTVRLVEMFNTARTLYHYKTASDRTATFSLADADKVLTSLFEPSRKTETKAASYVGYGEYDRRETDYNQQMEKAADVNVEIVNDDLSEAAAVSRAINAIRSVRKTATIAEDEARVAGYSASAALSKLAHIFAVGDTKEAMEDKYARLVASYKDQPEWSPVINAMIEFTPKKDRASDEKIAEAGKVNVIDDSNLLTCKELLKEAREMLEVESEFMAAASEFNKEADNAEIQLMEIVGLSEKSGGDWESFFRPEFIKAAQKVTNVSKYEGNSILTGDPYEVTRETSKGSPEGHVIPNIDLATEFVRQQAGNTISDNLNSVNIERAFLGPVQRDNKALSSRLQNIQRQIMLQDLLVNDPVLSEEDPATVMSAYDALLQTAPDVASNKEVTRAILRQTIHSVAVSPYDAEMWTKLERSIRNVKGKGTAPSNEDNTQYRG